MERQAGVVACSRAVPGRGERVVGGEERGEHAVAERLAFHDPPVGALDDGTQRAIELAVTASGTRRRPTASVSPVELTMSTKRTTTMLVADCGAWPRRLLAEEELAADPNRIGVGERRARVDELQSGARDACRHPLRVDHWEEAAAARVHHESRALHRGQ